MMEGLKFQRFVDLADAVRQARGAALAEARKSCGRGCYRSRGVEIVGANSRGDKVTEGGTWYWDGTIGGLERDIRKLREQFAGLALVTLEGGHDFSQSLRSMLDGDYDPWVSDWSVPVWEDV